MKDYTNAYQGLNELQRSAVDSIDGPVLVLAGPGTGKTQLLSVRAAAIMKKARVKAENILILTFTNSAVRAMRQRLADVIGWEGYDVEVGTFHGFANSIIQESEEAAQYAGDKIQMSEIEQVRAVEYILDRAEGVGEIRPSRAPYLYMDDILNNIGELKREGIAPDDLARYLKTRKAADTYLEEKHIRRLRAFAIIYKRYEELKEGREEGVFDERGRYDFDDMIIFATQALKKEKALREKYGGRFRYIMVDEYQDTNGAQLELLFELAGKDSANLCCVGDDDQSIYRFQGASVGNFKALMDRFPSIKVFHLRANYRSTKNLMDASNAVIGLIPSSERMPKDPLSPSVGYGDTRIEFKECSTEEEELLCIVEKVRWLKGVIESAGELSEEERRHPYKDIAVLVRKRSDIIKIVDAFLKAGIPYATDGKEDISQEFRARQLLDILELAHILPEDYRQKDLALYKVLVADYFRIPLADIIRFIEYVQARRRHDGNAEITLLEAYLDYFSARKQEIKFEKDQAMRHAAGAITRLLNNAPTKKVHSLLIDFIKDAGVFEYILKEYDEEEVLRIRQLRSASSFVNMVKRSALANPAMRLDDFMAEIRTRRDHGLGIKGSLVTMTQEGVRVLTAHGAKGEEFHSVIIPFCLEKRNWPGRQKAEKLPLPANLFKTKEKVKEKESLKKLFFNDETRLFYVALTRAKAHLVLTASPTEDSIASSYIGALGIRAQNVRPRADEELILKTFVETTDLEDPFIETGGVLRDMVENFSLNPTRINTYLTCARRFLYNDVLKIPGPKKKGLVFGNCVHKALEETYREYQTRKTFPPFGFFQKSFERELKFQGVDESIELHCLNAAQQRMLKDWFEETAGRPVMPIGLEKKLLVTVGGDIPFTGKYDKVEWQDQVRKFVRIIDYKTGKPDDHFKSADDLSDIGSSRCDNYTRQIVCYKLLYEKDKARPASHKVTHGVLVFIEPLSADIRRLGYKKGARVDKVIALTDAMVERMEKVIKDVWAKISALRFEKLPCRDKEKCGHCDYDGICWR